MENIKPALNKLIIVGAGGLGRSLMSIAKSDPGNQKDWVIGGFLDSRDCNSLPSEIKEYILGSPINYIPNKNEYFIIAVGDADLKKKFSENLLERHAKFMNFLPGKNIGEGTFLGEGIIFFRNVSVGVNCKIGNFVCIDQNSIIGHDVIIEDYVHIGTAVNIAGGVKINSGSVINSGAILGKDCEIGKNATIAIGAVILRNVPDDAIMIGNPAKNIR
jgi:sugar O-acyltransferase (sialic acid O-acetyltransferase NeuD family)